MLPPCSLFCHRRAALLFVAALIASCGGGVDSGGTGAPATAFASGAITGFGSVIVAGVHFDERAASVRDADGNARSRDDLRLGMTVEARGNGIFVDGDGNDASIATSIVISSSIVGPIAANDAAARTLTILGQTVQIGTTTVFEDALAGGQAALRTGDIVEVYANLDTGTGHYLATRVERKTAVAAFSVRGVVANLDSVARTFSIGATRISYSGLTGAGISVTLANGSLARASLGLVPGAGGVWPALRIGEGAPAIEDRQQAEVEGLVDAFTSPLQFSVNGTPVDARSAEFPDGTTGVAIGRRVEVEGSITGGVLVASRVKLASDSQGSGQEFQVRGAVVSIDAAAKTFVVRNVVVSYSGAVDFRDGTAADLAMGREVEARGVLSADGTRLQASRIDFRH